MILRDFERDYVDALDPTTELVVLDIDATDDETHDNIVVYWRPDDAIKSGDVIGQGRHLPRFIEEGWSVKKLVRTLVLSRAYRLGSEEPDGG